MKEQIDKFAEIAKLAGEIVQKETSDSRTRTTATNIQKAALEERAKLIKENFKPENYLFDEYPTINPDLLNSNSK